MRIVRRILLDLGFISELAELIELIMRHRGRPLKNGANSANSRRFWTVPRSTTSTDRILITLKRDYPQEFEHLCAGKYSVAEAAKRVGLIGKVYGKGRWGLNDIAAAVKLGPKAQADLLCERFQALPVDAQSALLSRAH